MNGQAQPQPADTRLLTALARQRSSFHAEMNPTAERRMDRLNRVLAMTLAHETRLVRAIDEDFAGRARQETLLTDIFTVRAAVSHARRNLKAWMRPRRVRTTLQFLPARNELLRQPLGVVGVMSPWNYPYQLALCPTIAALAAGNRVMVKPSELTPRFSELLAGMVGEYFDSGELTVITGGADVGREFADLPLDHLLFTGSTAVGRQVAQAAARNLTPVTLELGGKSPALVDISCDFKQAAPRIAYGKLLNAGQTCVAPDYLLVPRSRVGEFSEAVLAAMRRMYPHIEGNPDYTSIVTPRHARRLQALLDDARRKGALILPLCEGEAWVEGPRRLTPTLLLGATADMTVMQEEIFGPLLPVVAYDSLDGALDFIHARERPLALYWFGRDKRARDRVLHETISGGVTINDCIWHLGQENQPFGGVGASGQGRYHGEWGYLTFSMEKPVFHQSSLAGTRHLHPPYGVGFDRLLGLLHRLI